MDVRISRHHVFFDQTAGPGSAVLLVDPERVRVRLLHKPAVMKLVRAKASSGGSENAVLEQGQRNEAAGLLQGAGHFGG